MREQIPPALAGERVDKVVALLTDLTRSEVAALIEAGGVTIGRRVATKGSRKLQVGEWVEVEVPERADPRPVADPTVEVPVVHEDPDVLVVDKPAGLVVHPGAGNGTGTMVHGLLARYPELAEVGDDPTRPGIVHRLDAGTSGLLVVARTASAYGSIVAQLSARTVTRHYWALVAGEVVAPAGRIEGPIGRDPRDPTRQAVVEKGRDAVTGYTVVERRDGCTLVECRLETGRTHQIRVHLAAIGHPVLGDPTYHGPPRDGLDRPWLHAHHLAFDHPATGERAAFDSPLPADLAAVRG